MKRVTRENAMSTLKKEIECQNNTSCTWSEDCDGCSYATNEQDLLDALEMAIEVLNIPARPKGKWIIEGKTDSYIKWHCSECKTLAKNPQKPWYKFCPNCGADMRESE